MVDPAKEISCGRDNMKTMNATNPINDNADPLIDEVRAIRRSICDEFGNDVEKLVEHLRAVEAEYRTRTGRFADVPHEVDGELFPDAARDEADPFLADLRELRKTQ